MRITGGECRGRVIAAPQGLDVRPTGSKERQAFFNILGNKVPDARFVDVCAGSGLMGFEALSRGARSLICVEENKRFAQAIQSNARTLGFDDRIEVITGDARRVLTILGAGEADVIFCDPPYKAGLAEPILQLIGEKRLLSADGIAVVETAGNQTLPEFTSGLERYDQRRYGQTAFTFYKVASAVEN